MNNWRSDFESAPLWPLRYPSVQGVLSLVRRITQERIVSAFIFYHRYESESRKPKAHVYAWHFHIISYYSFFFNSFFQKNWFKRKILKKSMYTGWGWHQSTVRIVKDAWGSITAVSYSSFAVPTSRVQARRALRLLSVQEMSVSRSQMSKGTAAS